MLETVKHKKIFEISFLFVFEGSFEATTNTLKARMKGWLRKIFLGGYEQRKPEMLEFLN